MAAHLSFLLLLTGFIGIHSISTVSKVSVKAGESISIPCLYNEDKRNNVKYLCKGHEWKSCSFKARTDNQNLGKNSISDDKNQNIFTVTIKDLEVNDTDYWCGVEVNYGYDPGERFHLLVIKVGWPRLYVEQQEITRFIGEDLIIRCYSSIPGQVKWCKLGSSCVEGSSGSIDRTNVTIETGMANVSTVTMKELRTENSGWYWCDAGEFQMPVHVTVTERPTMTTTQSPSHPSVNDNLVKDNVKLFIILLCLLVLAVMATCFTLVILKRNKQTKEESSVPTMADKDVMYTDVMISGKTSRQRSPAGMKRATEVVYTNLVIADPPTV